ncbi:(E2-independent) E3 ubiquitin-conjugating enzyme FATS [Tiliqua scincoides]|uniref:(E2-independent) E3 ubiquitin-conjugating enzyme FATS n=1 Tax=Tiliqua scincoides TaxID=71010 RepID=UPI00346352F6
MPSQTRGPVFLRCTSHTLMDLRGKPLASLNPQKRSFRSHLHLVINLSSWGRPRCCLGIREHCGANAWDPCKSVPYNNAAENESSFTKDSLPSQNAKMISSIVISQLIDENKSKENKAAFPMQPVITQSDGYHMNQSLTDRNSVSVSRAFILLPRRLGIQLSSDGNVLGTNSRTKEEKPSHSHRKGFASITITARRVGPPPCILQEDASDPSCSKCQEGKLLMNTAVASNMTESDQSCRPLHTQRCCQNRNATKMKVSEPCPQLCKGQSDWIFSTGNKENRMAPPQNSNNKQAPTSFTSSIHLSISQQCPNTIYYLDKSLSVPVDQPQSKNQKTHRSVVSFNINCSSPSLTPDGVDGLANGELITEVLKTKFPEESKSPLRATWNADLKENYLDKKQTLELESSGTQYLCKGTSPSQALTVVDGPQGLDQLSLTKTNDEHSNDNHLTLPPHIPPQTFHEGTQAFSGSNRKPCIRDIFHETAPISFLEQSSKKEFMVESGRQISLKDKYPSKGTSKSKEIQVQSYPNQKIFVTDSGCHIKAFSKTVLDENDIHRKDPFQKGDYRYCGSANRLKECKKSEKKELFSRVTNSTAHEPDVTHEKYEAFQQPEVCSEPEKIPSNPLTLREALEVHKPHFISRSQERLKKLEHMVQLRKAQQGDASGKKQGAILSRKLSSSSLSSKKRQYTVPHPLSDNLFKPKERFISEKEMHMRSKRIYNNLPEVKKKQEEKQKRVIIQSNRMRVEIFKKQLLDHLLQRNTE